MYATLCWLYGTTHVQCYLAATATVTYYCLGQATMQEAETAAVTTKLDVVAAVA
jgi:hypothetical protein